MAFCSTCGNQLAEGARFCTACGESTGVVATSPEAVAVAPPVPPAPQPAQPQSGFPQPVVAPKKRSPLVWLVPVLIVGIVLVGAAGWFGISLLTGGTQTSRARAQAEAVADLFEGFTRGDVELLKSALPADVAEIVEDGAITVDDSAEVTREWEGDTLVLAASSDDNEWNATIEITADGDKDSALVTVATYSDGEEDGGEALVEREGRRWVVVELDGTPVRESLGFVDDSGDGSSDDSSDESSDSSSDDSSDNSSSDPTDEEVCFTNQRMVESAAEEYFFAAGENEYSDISGEVDESNWLVDGGYLGYAPTCPADYSYYWLNDDGTTTCPSGEHGYYLDEE